MRQRAVTEETKVNKPGTQPFRGEIFAAPLAINHGRYPYVRKGGDNVVEDEGVRDPRTWKQARCQSLNRKKAEQDQLRKSRRKRRRNCSLLEAMNYAA